MSITKVQLPSPPRYSRYGLSRDGGIQLAVSALTILLVLAPLLPILYQSVLDRPIYESGAQVTIQNYVRLATEAGFGTVLWNTLIYGLGSTVIAQIVGLAAAILIARTNIPLRGVISSVLLWPLYISSIVLAFGWITMYGPSGLVSLWVQQYTGSAPWNLYSLAGLCLITGVAHVPITFLYCIGSARLLDPDLENAARVSGAAPWQILLKINLPLLMPALVLSATMNFVSAIESLAIPLVIGAPVGLEFLTTFLYSRGLEQSTKDYGLVGAAGLFLLVLVILLLMLQNRLLRFSERFVTLGGKASRARLLDLGRFRWVAFALMAAYLLIGVGPVIIGVTLRAFTTVLSPYVPIASVLTLDNFRYIFSFEAYTRSIWNTLLIATVGGIAGTALVAAIALIAQRSQMPGRKALEFVALFPRAVPGMLVGIGAFYAVALLPFLGPLRNSIAILMIVFIMRFIPSGYGAVTPMLLQIGKDLDRASRTVGADWWTTSTRVIAPLLRPALVSCFAIMFIHMVKEYASAVFLFAPGGEVMGTTMLTFWVQGDVGPVAALALLQIAIITVFVLVARHLLGVKFYG
ncbi:MAG: iron ABC transporter permease [Burkholderiales bacterium]|nr:MAG: iron ABC transporter permease [Burkholderiales bacterium]